MLTINKIREKRNFLLIIIILAMLLFLLPYDAIMSFFTKSDVGSVNGAKVSIAEWQNEIQKRDATLLVYPNNSRDNNVWYDVVEKRILGDDYDKLGIDVSEDEYNAITLEKTPSAFVLATFHGGTVSDATMQNYANHVNRIPDNSGYLALKELIINKRKREKWESILKKGLYANSLEAKYDFMKKEKKVDIDYVFVKYEEMPDSIISYNDSDLRAYYNEHKDDADMKVNRENRDIRYVEFVVEASAADSALAEASAQGIVDDWNNEPNDTIFFQRNPVNFNEIDYYDGDYTSSVNAQIISDSVGSVIGPFKENANSPVYSVAKIIDRMDIPDSVQVRHILFKVENTMGPEDVVALKAEADSIMQLIADGVETFEDMAKEHSDDPGYTDENGGNYGWFKDDGTYVKPFEDFGFERELGDLDIVQTNFGYHVMEVVEQSPKNRTRTKLRKVDVNVIPSEDTKKEFYRKANDFSLACGNSPELFEMMADSMALNINDGKNIYRTNKAVGALREASDLVSWTYQMDATGNISPPRFVEGKYVVALLDKIKMKGIPEFENIKEEIEEEVIKQKKGEYYADLMDGDDLQSIAEAVGTDVKKARGMSLNSANINGSQAGGAEPEVVGLCFGFDVGQMSSPIIGEYGVYVIAPTTAPTEVEEKEFYITEQDALIKAVQGTYNAAFSAMNVKADVQDDRLSN